MEGFDMYTLRVIANTLFQTGGFYFQRTPGHDGDIST